MKSDIIKELIENITSNLNAIDATKRYDDMLNECYDFKSVGGPFAYMLPSKVLEEIDPTAYRCGFNDYLDSEREVLVEIDSKYYDAREVEEIKQEMIDELDEEICAAAIGLEDLQDVEDVESERAELNTKIANLEELKDEIEDYTF